MYLRGTGYLGRSDPVCAGALLPVVTAHPASPGRWATSRGLPTAGRASSSTNGRHGRCPPPVDVGPARALQGPPRRETPQDPSRRGLPPP